MLCVAGTGARNAKHSASGGAGAPSSALVLVSKCSPSNSPPSGISVAGRIDGVTRRLRDPVYRQEQLKDLYAAHVKPVNKLVDELRVDANRWMPHVAPLHGGTE